MKKHNVHMNLSDRSGPGNARPPRRRSLGGPPAMGTHQRVSSMGVALSDLL